MRKTRFLAFIISAYLISGNLAIIGAQERDNRPPTRTEFREMIKSLDSLSETDRKARIQEMYEKFGKPMLARMNKTKYQPGIVDANTKVFEFKEVPGRTLKIYVRYPDDWKPSDSRPAILFWHGGGFTQGGASQFYHQARYFNERGLVVGMPEYRIRDVDGTLPNSGLEDAISAMRWFRKRAHEFGVDPEKIVAGGGSAGGCVASVLGTADAKALADLGCIGAEDDPEISFRPSAMLLYNPFVDFFEPLNDRHIAEECLMLGKDPKDLIPIFHELSGIEQLSKDSPPSIILFGTRDAFYPQQVRWITKCRELGLLCHEYVYKGEVHSWYNNSPHLEYTTANVDKFLVEIGILKSEPKVELPHNEIQPNRLQIQSEKYRNKKDWDEQERFQKYIRKNNIELIPFEHYKKESTSSVNVLPDGIDLFGGKGLTALEPFGNDKDGIDLRMVKVEGMDFKRAYAIKTTHTPKFTDGMSLAMQVDKPIKKGDVLFLTMYLRSPENENDIKEGILSAELRKEYSDRSLGASFTAGKEWKQCYVSSQATRDYAPGEAMFRFSVGFRPQTLHIGNPQLLNLEQTISQEELPRMSLSYRGMEKDAPWRKAAADRIEKYRKSDIKVSVSSSNGQPVENAQVSIVLKKHAFAFGGPYAASLHVDEAFSKELPIFQKHFLECFNKAVLPNSLKWKQFAEKGTTWAPPAYDWLTDNGYEVRGHNLIWPGWNFMPSWVRKYENDPEKLKSLTRERIEEVMTHWSGKLAEWDVTNEPWRQDDLMEICGWDVFLDWYHWARELDPDTKLYYNDANTLVNNQPGHQDHYFNTIKWMLKEGAPVDGMGFESHVRELVPLEAVYERIDRFAQLGPDMQITEFDVGHPEASDELLAQYARDFITTVFSHPKPIGIITWLGGNPLRIADTKHPSGRPQSAFYDANWNPTPLGQVWLDLKNKEWHTNEQGMTNNNGIYQTRGFHGEYEISVSANGKTKSFPVTVGKETAHVNVTL